MLELPEVVVTHARAHDQNPLIAQRSEGLSPVVMALRIQIVVQRHGHHRQLGLRIHDLERNENAVIPTPFVIHHGIEPSLGQALRRQMGQSRCP